MGNFTKREQIVILIFVIVIIASFGYQMYVKRELKLINADTEFEDFEMTNSSLEAEKRNNSVSNNETDTTETILVHIDGEVLNPGVVELPEGARVIDVINIAGGLTKYADDKRINLAKRVNDEEKVYVPKIGEDSSEADSSIVIQNYSNNIDSKKVNINTAGKDELKQLSGIGDVIADRIIEYRQSNKFSNIDDIKKVSGIGDKKFEAIKDFIKVK